MCRLTLVYPRHEGVDPNLALFLTGRFLITNGLEAGQDDGAGIALVNKLGTQYIKSADSGAKFVYSKLWWETMEQEWAPELTPDSKFIGHVRAATPGIKVTSDNSHPFMYDGITGAHNGFIRNKAEFDPKIESDSEAFFKYLAEQLGNKPLTYPTLKENLEKINGAFCMLLNDQNGKMPNAVWVVVGKGRELHFVQNEHFTIINTTKGGFGAIYYTYNVLRSLGNPAYKMLEFDADPVKLEPENIFLAHGSKFSKLGPVKENDTPPVVTTSRGDDEFWQRNYGRGGRANQVSSSECRLAAMLWGTFLETLRILPTEGHALAQKVLELKGRPDWTNLTIEQLNTLDRFSEYITENGFLDGVDAKSSLWYEIKHTLFKNTEISEDYEWIVNNHEPIFQFPFFLNTLEVLTSVHSKIVRVN